MDPRQALIDLLECIAARDIAGAGQCLDALDDWIHRGGFIPESIHAALDALRFAD